MTKQEVAKLLTLATGNFPSYQEKDMKPTLILWEKMLADIPYEVAEKALMRVLSTEKFFPTISDIRSAAVELTQPRIPTHGEAWEEVIRAIRNYGGYREEEGLKSLSFMAQKAAKAVGWKPLCYSEEPDVIRGQFRKAYESLEERERTDAKIPDRLKEMIANVLPDMSKPRIQSNTGIRTELQNHD